MKSWKVKKLSTALGQALDDLKKVERRKSKYKVDMLEWHTPNSHCSVCLAGARMVGLGEDPTMFSTPDEAPDLNTRHMLYAMDCLRKGEVESALSEINDYYDVGSGNRSLDKKMSAALSLERDMPAYYPTGPKHKKWWLAMRKLQRDLKKARL